MSSSKLLLLCFALMMAEGFSQLDCNEEMLQQPIPKSKGFFLVLLIAEFRHTSECQNKFLTTSFTLTVLNFRAQVGNRAILVTSISAAKPTTHVLLPGNHMSLLEV